MRFTAAQTGALERRFNASKYLSPDERRALATTLRLSDRQVCADFFLKVQHKQYNNTYSRGIILFFRSYTILAHDYSDK